MRDRRRINGTPLPSLASAVLPQWSRALRAQLGPITTDGTASEITRAACLRVAAECLVTQPSEMETPEGTFELPEVSPVPSVEEVGGYVILVAGILRARLSRLAACLESLGDLEREEQEEQEEQENAGG